MRFEGNDNLSKLTLGDSYNKNYKFLFESTKKNNNSGLQTFNNIPVFKYEKLVLKFQKEPTKEQIIKEIKEFMKNNDEDLRVYSVKGNVFKVKEDVREYVINIAFINFDIKSK